MEEETRIYHTLDGLRGVASLIVFGLHFEIILACLSSDASTPIFRGGYLAVDLFFVLSGFVLEHSYGRKFSAGLSPMSFMVARYVRLYPLYALGAIIGIASGVVAYRLGAGELNQTGLGSAALSALLILPSPTWSQTATLFVLNSPGWSLFFELAVNLAFATLWLRLSTPRLLAIIACSAILFGLATAHAGTADLGSSWPTFPAGFPRVAYSFFAGVLVYRWRHGRTQSTLAACLVPAAATLILLADVPPNWRGGFDIVATLCLFPLLIAAGARWEPAPRLVGLFRSLGLLSYPLYALHFPILELIRRSGRFAGMDLIALRVPLFLSSAALLLGLSWLAAVYYDVPVRKQLNRLVGSFRLATRAAPAHVKRPDRP